METQNLWPDFAVESVKSPKTILKEQAGYFMTKTNNVLSADVETNNLPNGEIMHEFYIVAPAIDNYRYRVLYIMHKALFYPLYINDGNYAYEVHSLDDFVNVLSKIFSKPEIMKVVSSLLSQSLAE